MENYIPTIVSILGAGGAAYLGVKVAIAEMRTKITNNEKSIDRHEREFARMWDKIDRIKEN